MRVIKYVTKLIHANVIIGVDIYIFQYDKLPLLLSQYLNIYLLSVDVHSLHCKSTTLQHCMIYAENGS